MQKVKGSEGTQKPSPTLGRGIRHLRNSSSDSDPLQRRPIIERSSRFVDHRSPNDTPSDPPLHQKKLGTRITDLETQLVQAQHELKSLKHQLASAELERKSAQEELHNKGSKKLASTQKIVSQKKPGVVKVFRKLNSRDKPTYEVPEDVHWDADVFEVLVEKHFVEPKVELGHSPVVEDLKDTKSQDSSITEEQEKENLCDEAASNNEEIDKMRAMLEEKNKAMQILSEENETLKKLLDEAKSEIGLARSKEEEMALKVSQLEEDLEVSLGKEAQLKEKLSEIEVAKEELENEMKRMKVQTEQWKKAADAAASLLAGGVDMKGRISERCASMDNHFNNIFEYPFATGFGGYLSKIGDHDDNFGVGKKKGSGIRMLGDLWKKKGQK